MSSVAKKCSREGAEFISKKNIKHYKHITPPASRLIAKNYWLNSKDSIQNNDKLLSEISYKRDNYFYYEKLVEAKKILEKNDSTSDINDKVDVNLYFNVLINRKIAADSIKSNISSNDSIISKGSYYFFSLIIANIYLNNNDKTINDEFNNKLLSLCNYKNENRKPLIGKDLDNLKNNWTLKRYVYKKYYPYNQMLLDSFYVRVSRKEFDL